MSLLALTLQPMFVWILVLVVVAAVLLVMVVAGIKHRVDAKQKRIVKACAVLREYGWNKTADLMADIAVGDYSQAIGKAVDLAEEMGDPAQAALVIAEAVCKSLPKLLTVDGTKERILKIVRPAMEEADRVAREDAERLVNKKPSG